MKITKVKVTKYESGNTKGFASITLDDCFLVTNLTIMSGSNGLFVKMPSKKVKEEYKDICFPVTKEFRKELQDAVLNEYNGGGNEFDAFSAGDIDMDAVDELLF